MAALEQKEREELDRLLVCGEEREGRRYFLSVREVAARFKVQLSVASGHSANYGCMARRDAFRDWGHYTTPPFGEIQTASRDAWIIDQCKQRAPVKPAPVVVPEPPPPQPSTAPFLPDVDPNEEPYDREPIKRTAGRPRNNEAPAVPWNEIDYLLVMGVLYENPDRSTGTRYPTQAEIAERFGIDRSVVSKYWQDHSCMQRRKQAQTRIAIRTEENIIESRAASAAVSREETLQVLDSLIVGFRKRLADGAVRTDSVTDLNTVIRLKEFMQGGADSRTEIQGALTLSAIQSRHSEFIELESETSAVESIDADGVALDSRGQPAKQIAAATEPVAVEFPPAPGAQAGQPETESADEPQAERQQDTAIATVIASADLVASVAAIESDRTTIAEQEPPEENSFLAALEGDE